MVMDLLGPSLDAYFKHCYLVAAQDGTAVKMKENELPEKNWMINSY